MRLPMVELVSRVRARPFYPGLLKYDVRVHHRCRVGRSLYCRVHRCGAGHRRNRERRTVGGHHRVHCRAPAHHLLHYRFFFSVQA